MLRFVLHRIATAIPTLFLVVALAFFLIRVAPGGPFDLERPLDPVAMANLERVYGLDRPLLEQFLIYLAALARGDLGPSLSARDFSVRELLAAGLPVSMTLGALALALAVALGGLLGSLAALRHKASTDHAVMGLAALGLTIPSFVVAPVLQIVFGLTLGWLPVGGWNEGAMRNLVLPVTALALPQIAVIARLTRAAMVESLRADHIRTLRALGLPRRVILVHALRGATLPVVSYLGPAAAALLTGSVVVETIFGLPGIGRYFVEGALNRDYPLVMGTVLLVGVFVLLFNLVIDLLYGLIDPRIRHD